MNTYNEQNEHDYNSYFTPAAAHAPINEWPIACNRRVLMNLLLEQWNRITRMELEGTRFIKSRIARLIETKYGINPVLTENYLSNLERTLPLSA